LKRVVFRGFTTPCSTSSWYTRAPVFHTFLTDYMKFVTEVTARPSRMFLSDVYNFN
jgi:hypothetical protein